MKITISKSQWNLMSTSKNAQINNPLNGKSKVSARNNVYKLIYNLTKGFFKDNSWENVNKIWNTLSDNGIIANVEKTEYFNNEKGESAGKIWYFEIPFENNKSREDRLIGTLTASFCGSVQDPSDRYDISFVV